MWNETFKMVEDWQLHKIIRRYKECMSYSGAIPKDVLWWSLRKRDKHQQLTHSHLKTGRESS